MMTKIKKYLLYMHVRTKAIVGRKQGPSVNFAAAHAKDLMVRCHLQAKSNYILLGIWKQENQYYCSSQHGTISKGIKGDVLEDQFFCQKPKQHYGMKKSEETYLSIASICVHPTKNEVLSFLYVLLVPVDFLWQTTTSTLLYFFTQDNYSLQMWFIPRVRNMH